MCDSITRLIPAHAGKTTHHPHMPGLPAAHPRSRGENSALTRSTRLTSGSSPLTRGKRGIHRVAALHERLIPAHAGKTTSMRRPRSHSTAHPRSRGENEAAQVLAKAAAGSSPLTRGKPLAAAYYDDPARLIPAHAGKTDGWQPDPALAEAHPRSRGENKGALIMAGYNWGSSPLTRGKQPLVRQNAARTRLIPAHAGKTASTTLVIVAGPAHPRSRGENVLPSPSVPPEAGSSPLTRGKLRHILIQQRRMRLIPAHAGKTVGSERWAESDRAHPRSRGENCVYCATI